MKLKDETGIAFPLVLIVVLVLTMLGVTLYMFSTAETRQVLHDENKMKAHYIARSGAHAVASHIIANPADVDVLIASDNPGEYDFGDGKGKYFVEVVDESYDGEIRHRVVSRGVVNNVSQTIEVTVVNQGVDCAVYANSINIDGGGNATISNADVIFGGGDRDSPDYDDTIEGLLEEGRKVRFEHIEFDPVILPCEDPELDFEGCEAWESEGNFNGNNLPVTESKRYGNIDASSITIDNLAGDDLLLKADRIRRNAGNGAEINVTLRGNTVVIVADIFRPADINLTTVDDMGGFLLIYTSDYYTRGNQSSRISLETNCHLNVYITCGGHIDIGGTPNFYGAIYAPHADTFLAGNSMIEGWVIAETFEISGGGTSGVTFQPVKMRETSMNFDFYRIEKWRYFD